MAVSVPGERGDAIARADSERSERVGQLPRATMQLAVGRAVKIALDAARDDLDRTVMPIRVLDQRRDVQRHRHHQTLNHRPSPAADPGAKNRLPCETLIRFTR